MSKRGKKSQPVAQLANKSDKFTKAAVEYRRALAAKITDEPMPLCLTHLNMGQMEDVDRVVSNDRFVKIEGTQALSIGGLLDRIGQAQAAYRLEASQEALVWAGLYQDTYCACEIVAPRLEWR